MRSKRSRSLAAAKQAKYRSRLRQGLAAYRVVVPREATVAALRPCGLAERPTRSEIEAKLSEMVGILIKNFVTGNAKQT
jgi:hypothetical protein